MKKIFFMLTIIWVMMGANSAYSQIKATTHAGETILFNEETKIWQKDHEANHNHTMATSKQVMDIGSIKSFHTKKGELSMDELKQNYLSNNADAEVIHIVKTIFEANCNCKVCKNMTLCTDCEDAKDVPCEWCCR